MAKLTTTINFQPTRDWLVLPMSKQDETESGIYLPEGKARASLKKNVLPVIAHGPKCELIKTGDTVMIHPTSEGLVIDVEGKEYVMVNEFTICGVIPNPK
mgnify:CR=1 FL=1